MTTSPSRFLGGGIAPVARFGGVCPFSISCSGGAHGAAVRPKGGGNGNDNRSRDKQGVKMATKSKAAEKARKAEAAARAAVGDWESRLETAQADAVRVEQEAGDAALAGGDVGALARQLAEARAAVDVARGGLAAAQRQLAQAGADKDALLASELRAEAQRRHELAQRQLAAATELWESQQKADGVVYWRVVAAKHISP